MLGSILFEGRRLDQSAEKYSFAGISEYVNISITNHSGASVTLAETTHSRRIVLYYTEKYAHFAVFLRFGLIDLAISGARARTGSVPASIVGRVRQEPNALVATGESSVLNASLVLRLD